MIAGQFYYMGTCDVTVSSNAVTVNNCVVASNWATSVVHIYLGETPSTTCAPGQFGFQVGYTPQVTGSLSVTKTMARSSPGAPVYVMLHMGV